ncbi:MAG: hypothetical protein WC942_10670, partial [Clostridia bacterium]
QQKIRYEDVQDAIRAREINALSRYSLHELKSLGPGDEIAEPSDEPVPGESPYNPPEGGDSGMPGAGAGLGGMPGAPPSAPIGGGGLRPPSMPLL